MQQEREELQAQIAALQAENQSVKQQNQELQERTQELEEQNQQLQNKLKNIAMLDYEAMRSHTLKSMTTGKGSAASTSPQYKFASRATGKLIEDIISAISDIAPSTPTSIRGENTPDSQA